MIEKIDSFSEPYQKEWQTDTDIVRKDKYLKTDDGGVILYGKRTRVKGRAALGRPTPLYNFITN